MSETKDLVDAILKEEDIDINNNISIGDIDVDKILNEVQTTTKINENDLAKFTNESEAKEIQDLLSQTNKTGQADLVIEDMLKNINKIEDIEHINSITNLNFKDKRLEQVKKESVKTQANAMHFNTCIDFINFIEMTFIKSSIEKNEQIFQLKNYKIHTNNKLEVLKFPPKTTLSTRFFRDGNIITAITAKEDVIFTGNNLGKIKMYSCDKECEYKSLILERIKYENKRAVSCMDISERIDYLLAGYQNGFIALWDLASSGCKKLITDEHDSCVVALKFLKVQKKYYEFLSSDLKGRVNRTSISEGFIITTVDSGIIIKYNSPIFIIEILKFLPEDSKEFAFLKTSPDPPLIVAFASLDYIIIYQIDPDMKRLFELKKPDYFQNFFIPDISFGMGYIPRNTPSIILDNAKNKEKIDPNPAATNHNLDITKPYHLVAISWGKVIEIYALIFDNEKGIDKIALMGHYVNSNSILRMGFISNSIIYLLDMHKYFRILNTGLMTPGVVMFDKRDNSPMIQFNAIHKPELQEGLKLSEDILFQAYIPDKGSKDSSATKSTYNNLIISQNKTLYILGKKRFFLGKLLNWEQCLNSLHQESEWMNALSLGLDIYHGKNITLADIPINEKERKVRVGYILRGLILQYAIMNLSFENLSKENLEENIKNCINICIEFCIEIDDLDFLLNQVQPVFDMKGYLSSFIEKLEPFILCGKISDQHLGQITISKIVDFYLNQKKFDTLSQILINLNINSIDLDEIKQICKDNDLINPLIYISMNGTQEDYFYPIEKLYELYNKTESIKNEEYNEFMNHIEPKDLQKLEKSKQFLGHKLFWYINLCTDNKKYPNESLLTDGDKFTDLIQKIFLWLLKDQILTDLMLFDSYAFFILITKFFRVPTIFNVLDNIAKNSNNNCSNNLSYKNILLKGKEVSNLTISSMLEIIVDKALSLKRIYVKEDLYEFIIRIGCFYKNIEKQQLIESISFLINLKNNQETAIKNNEIDPFNMHTDSFHRNANYIKNISKQIINIFENYKQSNKQNVSFAFNEEDYKKILDPCSKTEFIQITIYLLDTLKEYIKCVDVYINNENIENRIEKTFQFIDEFLQKTKEKNIKLFKEYKNEILKRIPKLAEINIASIIQMTYQWFEEDHLLIAEKLSHNEHLKLEYIEQLLNNFYKGDNAPQEEKEIKVFENLLNMHIDLLCNLKMFDKILPNLKKRNSYDVDRTLEQVLKYHIVDAAIFLYQSVGKTEDALNIAVEELKKNLNILLKYVQENNMKSFASCKTEHEKIIGNCIEICENYIDESDNDKLWFQILQIFYNYSNKCKNLRLKEKDPTIISNYFQIITLLSKDIEFLYDKMYPYTGIKSIITNVTCNYKQAEFKEFKSVLTEMLKGNSFLRNILQIEKELLATNAEIEQNELNYLLRNGDRYNVNKCDICNQKFDNEDLMYLFKCGHLCHKKCCSKSLGYELCDICLKEEQREAVTSAKYDKIEFDDLVYKKRTGVFEDIIEKRNKNKLQNPEVRKQNYLKNLKNIDEYIDKTYNLLYDIPIGEIQANYERNKQKL